MTIHEHICRARLALAEARMLDPVQSIKEIAFAAGFRSTSAFDRRFVREHHEPPRAWRARELERRFA
jgi:AraC-like DNA-binding protein